MRQFIRKNIWAVAPVVFVLVALVLLGSPLSSSKVQETPAEDDNLIVVGVSQVGSESVWRSAHTQSIQDAFTRANGYMLIFDNARQKQANQIKAIRSFISQQVDYIVLSPIEESGWDTVLQEAKDAGIPVILIDRKVSVDDDSLYASWVGSDFVCEGQDAGYWLEDYMKKQGREDDEVNIVVLKGTKGASATIGRTRGFNEVAKVQRNWNILQQVDGEFTTAKGKEEMARLLDYKLYQLNLNDFSRRVNERFRKNGGKEQIFYSMNRDIEKMLSVTAEVYDEKQKKYKSINSLGKGMRSIYMLSLLETCEETMDDAADLIIVENPEIFLHPKLQNESGDILYRLSKKSQVIFSTHAANLLSNFNSRQIRQMFQGEDGYACISEKTDISAVLDDLGYSAGDLMNVNFVFIVEGRQDKSRLPLLLKKYYSEMYDENGNLQRIAIITTNSCTNIKTYANLKYMNQIYLKDNFLMIRDGDGRDREMLKHQLCKYYEERNQEDVDRLPRVMPKNVLILKYYSFENYFLNPAVMAQLGIVDSEQEFYEIFLAKWKEYLHRISSGKKLTEVLGKDLETTEDVKNHMEEIKTYLRGHNLYDIFYGRYKKEETELLTRYIELAPREDFADILDSIERFIYFESRKN